MAITRFKRIRQSLEDLFPERHLYVRSGGEMRGYVFSTGKQLMCATGIAAAALWMGVCTAAMMVNALSVSSTDQMVIKQKAYYERLNADRAARLNSAMAQLSASSGSLDELASSVEKRHAALALLVSDFKGVPGAAQALQTAKPRLPGASPVERIQATRMDQERLIDAAETFADTRAERLRAAMRMAGLDAGRFTRGGGSLGGPLIEAKDPRALAAILDVDEEFAGRIQHAANDMSDMRALSAAAQKLPFYRPTGNPALSSSYGVRFDPFTHRPAFHSGLDFPGAFYTPIMAAAPGVISFVGVRSGYGNVVEIDHGGGFKTRYAHLQATIGVHDRTSAWPSAQRIAAMGSTGRSTGPHLHYEVWVNGTGSEPQSLLEGW
jgi:murein DD-endopeptidase MepM/ murein hydrolase activator NlpD